MEKFKNRYRIGSHRKPGWAYSADAFYFLTIVTQNRDCNLGDINIDSKMVLSDFGKIVETEWLKSFEIRNELFLHGFIVMPNHIHAIVEIRNGDIVETHGRAFQQFGHTVESHGRAILPCGRGILPCGRAILPCGRGILPCGRGILPYDSIQSTEIPNDIKRNMPIRLPKSISSFMAGFKSAVNTKIDDYIDLHQLGIPKYNRNNHFFQPNYHDHIVRNEVEFERISNYIINNPRNWVKDMLREARKQEKD
jgi:REP element-mobilizing transposase RayT